MRRVWIDSDMGFDDLVAVLMLAGSPEIEIAGLSLVGGNAPLGVVADNAAAAAALFGWRMPVHRGRARPLIGRLVTAEAVLGPTAMRTVGRELPPAPPLPAADRAFDALVGFLEEAEDRPTVLALGPLTNLAVLFLARPELNGRIGTIIWLGGSAGAGNHTAAAEYNAFADPEAAEIVVSSGARFRMVGLDSCRPVTFTLDDLAPLRALGTERSGILADLAEGYIRIAAPDGGRPMPFYDAVAAAAVIAPENVGFAPARITVERGGAATRGMTVVERRVPARGQPNAEIAVSADAAAIRRLVLDSLLAAAEQG